MMTWFSWMIALVPVVLVIGVAFYSKRYVRDVADYLAAGRMAGRYVISVGDMSSWLSVIVLVAMSEQYYQCGLAVSFWNNLMIPIGIFMSLTGYCMYRFRQTRCLSFGQFLEMRYNRSFRIIASAIRTIAELITNAIGPAVAARFFIYFLDLPHGLKIGGLTIPTYALVVLVVLILAMLVLWPGGRISLLITDSLQGVMSYPIFVIFTVFVITNMSWFQDSVPVMADRVSGESFINPMDLSGLRDFNLFALVVTIIGSVLNRAAWIGNDTSCSGRTPHEQKMAYILGAWRNGFALTMFVLVSIFVLTFMFGERFSDRAHRVRLELSRKISAEIITDPAIRTRLNSALATIPAATHTAGKDQPYSREHNPDMPYLNTTRNVLASAVEQPGYHRKSDAIQSAGQANELFQKFRSLYYQMMLPKILHATFSPLLMGLFMLLMLMLLISTDNSRIFNAAATIVQDVLLPLRKTPFSTAEHLRILKLVSLVIAMLFFLVSLFFAQLDFINMFITIMCSLWMGAAGPIIVGGLYTRFGTTCGAFCSLIFGSGISLSGLMLQRNWAELVYPWLERQGYVPAVSWALERISTPFHPYVVWNIDPVKFPINSYELYFIAMIAGIAAYVVGSWLSYRKPYNLDRMLHRGIYAADESADDSSPWTWRNVYGKLIGITPEYSRGDQIIAWSVFAWSIIYSFGVMFVGVLIWNAITPWPVAYWGYYYFITHIVVSLVIGGISTVWFMIGGVVDICRLFRDLEQRTADELDDGRVEGGVSLSDKDHFSQLESTPEN